MRKDKWPKRLQFYNYCFLIIEIFDAYGKSHAVVRTVAETWEVAVLHMRSKIWPKINF